MRYLAPFALLGTYLVYYKNRPVMDHIALFSAENNFFFNPTRRLEACMIRALSIEQLIFL